MTGSAKQSVARPRWPPRKNLQPSFRGDAKHRTRNLEIPRCAIAHLRSGPSDHPGMTRERLRHARGEVCAYPATFAPLTKRQQTQPLMVNALLSVVAYFV